MTGSRTAQTHIRLQGADAPVERTVRHRLPRSIAGALDLDDAAAMRGHGYVDHVGCHCGTRIRRIAKTWMHQIVVGELMIDAEKRPIAFCIAEGERYEPDIVIVVAELEQLVFGGLFVRIESGAARDDRISPADENIRPMSGGDMVGVIDTVRHTLKIEARGSIEPVASGEQRNSADRCRGAGGSLQPLAAGDPAMPDFSECRRWVGTVDCKIVSRKRVLIGSLEVVPRLHSSSSHLFLAHGIVRQPNSE